MYTDSFCIKIKRKGDINIAKLKNQNKTPLSFHFHSSKINQVHIF